MNQTSETAFETNLVSTLTSSGWHASDCIGWDVNAALFPQDITTFLESFQPTLWTQLRSLHDTALERLAESEYSSALMTVAATGKIDVRDAVATVPLEPEVAA